MIELIEVHLFFSKKKKKVHLYFQKLMMIALYLEQTASKFDNRVNLKIFNGCHMAKEKK